MDLIEYDFNRICRACKCESSDMCSVFERNATTENNARFDEMLMACASVQVNCNNRTTHEQFDESLFYFKYFRYTKLVLF